MNKLCLNHLRYCSLAAEQNVLFSFHLSHNCYVIVWIFLVITGSAVALHSCKAHSKSIGKKENSTPCKIVTHENFILKLGIRDYVENITHYINFHLHRFSGGFSTNRWNITLLWLFSCPVLSFFSRTHAQLDPCNRFSRFMAQMTSFRQRIVLFGVRTMSDIIWGKCAPKTPQKGAKFGTMT